MMTSTRSEPPGKRSQRQIAVTVAEVVVAVAVIGWALFTYPLVGPPAVERPPQPFGELDLIAKHLMSCAPFASDQYTAEPQAELTGSATPEDAATKMAESSKQANKILAGTHWVRYAAEDDKVQVDAINSEGNVAATFITAAEGKDGTWWGIEAMHCTTQRPVFGRL